MTAPSRLASIAGVAEVTVHRGGAAAPDAGPDVVLEMPHGATRGAHFDALAAELHGPFPDGLKDFFFVNTDVGSGELGTRLAERLVAATPERSVVTIRCLIPRTFVDCNRIVARATDQRDGVTPGIAIYVRDERDRALLLERHAAYEELVRRAFDAVCGAGGRGMMLHTYAPRSVNVRVDDDIVASLRDAYEPEVLRTWPLRPEVDLITADGEGRVMADPALVAGARAAFGRIGIAPAENEAYFLHPATLAAENAARHRGRTLCLEIRRDLLVREFTPFAEMEVVPAQVDRFAAALEEALGDNDSRRS